MIVQESQPVVHRLRISPSTYPGQISFTLETLDIRPEGFSPSSRYSFRHSLFYAVHGSLSVPLRSAYNAPLPCVHTSHDKLFSSGLFLYVRYGPTKKLASLFVGIARFLRDSTDRASFKLFGSLPCHANSVSCFSPGHFRRRTSRLVSYYALFECVAASEPTS